MRCPARPLARPDRALSFPQVTTERNDAMNLCKSQRRGKRARAEYGPLPLLNWADERARIQPRTYRERWVQRRTGAGPLANLIAELAFGGDKETR
jgi:hypothetical protein